MSVSAGPSVANTGLTLNLDAGNSRSYPGIFTYGGAASFDGTSQSLSVASNSTLQTGNVDFWIAFWFYPTASATRGIASKHNWGGDTEWNISTYLNPGIRLYCGVHIQQNAYVAESPTYATQNAWNFGLYYNSATDRKVYSSVNGNAFGASPQYPVQGIVVSTTSVVIGRSMNLGGYFPGNLDSFAFGKPSLGWIDSNRDALRDYLYNSGSGRVYSALSSQQKTDWGLVSWWDLSEQTGTRYDRHGTNHLGASTSSPGTVPGVAVGDYNWGDISGYADHLVFNTGQTYSNNNGGVIVFDGVDDEIHPDTPVSYLASSAFEVVINSNSHGTGRKTIIGYRHNSGYAGPTIGSVYLQDNTLTGSVIAASQGYRLVTSSLTISTGQWYHIVFNKDTVAGTLELFVNGVSRGTQTFDTATFGQWPSAGTYLGANILDIGKATNTSSAQGWGSDFFNGQYALIKQYNRILTAAEVKQNFHALRGRFGL